MLRLWFQYNPNYRIKDDYIKNRFSKVRQWSIFPFKTDYKKIEKLVSNCSPPFLSRQRRWTSHSNIEITLHFWPYQYWQKNPLHLAYRLRDQYDMTSNMLIVSKWNPKLSSYTHLEDIFDFDANLLVLLGYKSFIREKPK